MPTYEGKYRRPPGTYSRRQVAALLNVSQSYVFRAVDGKGITPRHEGPRVHYDRTEVDLYVKTFNRRRALARPRTVSVAEKLHLGSLASRVFALLEQGKTFVQIVIETEGDPATVRSLQSEYATSFEQAAAKKRRAEVADAQRKELARLDKQRQREDYLASRAAPAAPREPAKRRFVPVTSASAPGTPAEDAPRHAPPRDS